MEVKGLSASHWTYVKCLGLAWSELFHFVLHFFLKWKRNQSPSKSTIWQSLLITLSWRILFYQRTSYSALSPMTSNPRRWSCWVLSTYCHNARPLIFLLSRPFNISSWYFIASSSQPRSPGQVPLIPVHNHQISQMRSSFRQWITRIKRVTMQMISSGRRHFRKRKSHNISGATFAETIGWWEGVISGCGLYIQIREKKNKSERTKKKQECILKLGGTLSASNLVISGTRFSSASATSPLRILTRTGTLSWDLPQVWSPLGLSLGW